MKMNAGTDAWIYRMGHPTWTFESEETSPKCARWDCSNHPPCSTAAPDDLSVEFVYGEAKDDQVLGQHVLPMSFTKHELDGSYRYDMHLKPTESGSFAYNARVVPSHPGFTEKYEMGLMKWA